MDCSSNLLFAFFALFQMETANSLLNEGSLQSYKSDRKLPAAVLAILEKAPQAFNWRANFDALIEGGPCLLFCRACDIGVSPNNNSISTNAHMKACKGVSTNRASCVVEPDLDSPSYNTRLRNGAPILLANSGLIYFFGPV